MKRNISVFILLILLASSFKYRTKAKETDQQTIRAGFTAANVLPKEEDSKAAFVGAVARLQQANQEFVKGNTESLKALWSHSADVTVFDGISNQELKGWEAVELNLNNGPAKSYQNTDYTFHEIASRQGDDQAYLLQEESYKKPGAKLLNLHVTMLFRKENNEWKIIHRHEDILTSKPKSDKTSK
ncbi:YybH family protein [Dyadobacter luticola]|uniref:SnoaL-like domain-containing protein n=1 Tax=Dyadobacter luticola TaxID=1979387 RepID=A0A5R9KSR1_9BACT|nr:nuclear transport factor 2 family protein [Dyadobacter luticola]TLU99144.1 hypothetical protein FEN17_21445 [Dyadobacter luticola]